jgi:phosphoserine phosphatase
MPIKVVFLDCDGTLTKVRSSWEYLHRELNLWTENADAYQALFRAGKIGYHEFCKRDAMLWEGMRVSAVSEIVDRIPYQCGAKEAAWALKQMGVITVIISSGLSLLVERVRGELSIDRAFSNELISKDGHLTGDIRINVEYDKKGVLVRGVLDGLGLCREEACAVGDGDGDSAMFDEVSLPIGLDADGAGFLRRAGAHTVTALADVVRLVRERL